MVFSILLMVGVAGTFWGNSIAEAASSVWGSCPRGRINCAYPGECHSYIDTNRDYICDRSQSKPVSTVTTTPVSSVTITPSVTTTGPENSVSDITGSQENNADTGNINGAEGAAKTGNRSYYFIPIFAALVVLYGLTWMLSVRKIIRYQAHRKIWNVILLISALVSALLGVFLTINVDFNTNITLPFNMLFWHVEAGIAMGIVAVFHICWHWRYFAKIFRVADRSKE